MAKCRACGRDVLWSRTDAGKAMPLSLPAVPDGNVWIEGGVAHVVSKERKPPPGARRYLAHFADCGGYERKRS